MTKRKAHLIRADIKARTAALRLLVPTGEPLLLLDDIDALVEETRRLPNKPKPLEVNDGKDS